MSKVDFYEKDLLPKVNGKFFKCECGCNVFRRSVNPSETDKNFYIYRCNACSAHYLGSSHGADNN